jgi:hypothetical protein
MRFAIATALICAFAATVNSTVVAEEFETRFQHIRVGLTRADVIAILGDPDAEANSVTLGVPHAWARWSRAGRTYKVQFLLKYVIETEKCIASSADC